MIKKISTLAAVFALGAGLATAQETGTPKPAEDLPLGQAVQPPAPAQAAEITKEQFGDWELQCTTDANVESPCQIYQLLNDVAGNPVAEFVMFPLQNQGQAVAGATVLVPLETLLTAQLTISIDDQSAKRYPFSFCNPVGCIARLGLTQEDVDAYKKGGKAVISIVPAMAPNQQVTINTSLKGFTAAIEKASASEK
ncbi:invasion associated locus B family protein [Shimia biformata]|uniref:invasion associated locus B family protein n=1 Tax=Shimia biformata TaxID=1294299 RepID=UPI00194E3BEC|nr:invasion associated locus B family protein [Shimia biformata]